MITDSEIRQQLAALLEQRISQAQFEEWLVARSWNMHKDSTVTAQDLVATIELALAEFSNGHLSDRELRQQLWAALNQVTVGFKVNADGSLSPRRPFVTASSAGQVRQAREVPALA